LESFYKIKRGKLSDLNLDELLFATGESFRPEADSFRYLLSCPFRFKDRNTKRL